MSELNDPGDAVFRFPEPVVAAFIASAFAAVGVDATSATTAAHALITADRRGVESHGIARLPGYLKRIDEGKIDPHSRLTVDRESPSTLALCANNGIGLVVAPEAMRRCIAKAEASGICLATVRHSNHFGIAGTYAAMAAERGLGGMAMTNASRLVVPTFAREPMLGTNPLAFAVPTGFGEPFVLDMSTSTVAWGKIEIARRAGLPIPAGWAVDDGGEPTTDPFRVAGLTPLGGDRVTSGHKGFGLSVMVDILCGPLSGNAWSNQIVPSFLDGAFPGIGHLFLAWRIDAFRDPAEFTAEVDAMLAELRAAPVRDGVVGRVVVPGDPEAEAERVNRRLGLPIRPEVLAELRAAAGQHGVPFTLDPETDPVS